MTEIDWEATTIVGSFIKAARNESVDIPAVLCVGLYDHVRMTLTRLSRPPAGFVRDDAGVDRRVLGTLPVTADGCIIGEAATVWMVSDNYRDGVGVYSIKAHIDWYEPDHPEKFSDPKLAAQLVKDILSSRAEAAAEKERGQ